MDNSELRNISTYIYVHTSEQMIGQSLKLNTVIVTFPKDIICLAFQMSLNCQNRSLKTSANKSCRAVIFLE